MALNYERIGWENAPSTNTPIDAGSLNHMDNGILAVSNQYDVDVPYLQQQVAGIPAMLDSYLAEEIGTDVTAWLNAHVTPGGSTIVVDDTLSISGAAADSAKCGELKNALTNDETLFAPIGLANQNNLIVGKTITYNKYYWGGWQNGTHLVVKANVTSGTQYVIYGIRFISSESEGLLNNSGYNYAANWTSPLTGDIYITIHSDYVKTAFFVTKANYDAGNYGTFGLMYLNENIIAESVGNSRNLVASQKLVNDTFSGLNDGIKTGITYGAENVVRGNMFPFRTDVIDGEYYSIDGNGKLTRQTNSSYYGFILKVKPNTEYHCTFFRFMVLLESDKETAIGSLQTSSTIINTGTAEYIAVSFDKTQYPVATYVISLGSTADSSSYKVGLDWLYQDPNIAKVLPNGVYVEKNSPAANSTLIVSDFSNTVKYNKSLLYEAHFSGTIGNITLYHGSGTYGSYVRVTPTNIIINASGSDLYNQAHNITIADYLYILLDTDDQNNIKVSVMSNGTRVEVTQAGWDGWQGQIFALTASALTYHRITWTCKDFDCPIWIFGDSYLSKTSQERWGYYLHEWGFDQFLCAGYPGASSANVIDTLNKIITITQPKYIIWSMGMNDPDSSSAINSTWKTNAEKVVQLCEQYGITPIFSKIPNANGAGTLYNHSFKNAWIDAGGYRSVDVPFAVGANASGNWYSGLLANDGIHPSWKGAQAIAYQYIADVPELVARQ